MKPKNSSSAKFPLIQLLPQGAEEQSVLQERADRIAKQVIANIQKTDIDTYVCFRLGPHEQYGLRFQQAKEVMHNLSPTKLPHAPDFIAGVINRRGSLLAVLDLKRLFHIKPDGYEKDTYILVAMGKKMTIGILADTIEGSRSYDPNTLDAPLPSEGIIKSEYISGLHQGTTALINIDAILSDIQVQVRSIL